MKSQVLHLVGRFSNPVWCKQVKQSLLQCKQRSPQVFQDPCLYSEVCKIMSESTYRLGPRRMLHELFLEVNYNDIIMATVRQFKMAAEKDDVDSGKSSIDMIKDERANNDDDVTDSTSSTSSTTNIKRLDSIRLAYKENKFPIRDRNESKFV